EAKSGDEQRLHALSERESGLELVAGLAHDASLIPEFPRGAWGYPAFCIGRSAARFERDLRDAGLSDGALHGFDGGRPIPCAAPLPPCWLRGLITEDRRES